jgi:hypothetical protein
VKTLRNTIHGCCLFGLLLGFIGCAEPDYSHMSNGTLKALYNANQAQLDRSRSEAAAQQAQYQAQRARQEAADNLEEVRAEAEQATATAEEAREAAEETRAAIENAQWFPGRP